MSPDVAYTYLKLDLFVQPGTTEAERETIRARLVSELKGFSYRAYMVRRWLLVLSNLSSN